jgi:hypothetical protein
VSEEVKRKQPKALDQITEGYWWVKHKTDGNFVVIVVKAHDDHPLHGVVAGNRHGIPIPVSDDRFGLMDVYDFIERIPEPA